MSENTSPSSSPAALAHRRPGLLGLGVAAVVLLTVLVNALAGSVLRSARIDLTQEKLYSLSPAVGPFLQGLDEPVRAEFFVSRSALADLPVYRAYATRVQEFLEEMQRVSGGKLRLTVLDPEPFSEAEDRARAAGLQQASTGQIGQTLTLGVVLTNTVDEREVLPFLDPQQEPTLEYDLVRAISGLAQPDKPKLGLITSLPMAGGPGGAPAFPGMPPQGDRPYVAYQQLEQLYQIQQIEPETEALPDDLDALMLAQPAGLSDGLLRSIDAYAHGGGRLLVFYDPQNESSPSASAVPGTGPDASGLDRLLAAWGVAVEPNQVVADPAYAERVQARSGRGLPVVPMLTWLGLSGDAVASDNPLTRSLQTVRLASAGAITQVDEAPDGMVLTPLLQSSDEASLADASATGPYANPTDLLRSHTPAGERYTVAARLTGPVKRAYPPPADAAPAAGSAPGDDAPATDAPAPASSPSPPPPPGGHADIVLVADADLLHDRFWIQDGGIFGLQATADNGAFLLSALEGLTGNPVLSGLRPRAASRRPFTRIHALQRAAETEYLAEEQRLQDEVRSTEASLTELLQQAPPDAQTLTLNPDQQAEIEKLQDQVLASRKALRSVQYALRRSIDRLGQLLMLVNVAAWPALVALVAALGLAWRWKHSHADA